MVKFGARLLRRLRRYPCRCRVFPGRQTIQVFVVLSSVMMGERAEPDPDLLIRIDRFLAGQDSTRTLLELGLVFL